ncbi:hypothetical protein ACWEQL_28765 [Kitasatospora sp. NPDC004240]
MANNENEAAVSAAGIQSDTAAAEAGSAVENAVVASPEQGEYAAPTADQQADIEDDLFGGESDRLVEPEGEDGPYEPQGIIANHP